MWENFDGKPYTRKAWLEHVDRLDLADCRWIKFITLHNTSSPTIAQWQSYPEQQRIMNLESYYEHSLGWHAGPHGFIPPDESCINTNGTVIFGFTDLDTPGVHASCFNHTSLGFEMVGEFNVSSVDTPPGSYVIDNAVFVLAVLHNKLGISPDNYEHGVRGLHFHIECARDNHDCPGVHARNKPWWIKAIKEEMAELKQVLPPAPVPAPISGNWQVGVLMTEFAGPSDRIGDRTDGYTGKLIDYRGHFIALPYHFPDWQVFRAEIFNPATSRTVIDAQLGDIGPWYGTIGPDKYWEKGTRPRAEILHAASGRTNGAGIDATQGVFDALGIPGASGYRSALINWRRVA